MNCPNTISCTTFNILAPIYKRLGGGMRESDFTESWLSRNENILDRLLHLKSSVICLQEFWMGNEELVRMYEKRLGDAGYLTYKLARTNNRGDGLLTAIHQRHFRVLNYRELLFNDIGDRVAQVLHVEVCGNISQNGNINKMKEVLIVNTHLIFPHDSRYCFLRLQQVPSLMSNIDFLHFLIMIHLSGFEIQFVFPFQRDWNGSKKGHVYKFLRSQGFESSYDIAHHCEKNTDDLQKLTIGFLSTFNQKNLLQSVTTGSGDQMSEIFRIKGSCITYSDFCEVLEELGICGHPCGGLNEEDIREIWERIDEDGDGIADVPNFLRAWSSCLDSWNEEHDKKSVEEVGGTRRSRATIGFVVKKATLFPKEAEKGIWPESYLLSDHAHLTVEFAIKNVHCTL
ncbi:hypothetical protein KSS87_003530 [Heliosperma pusillum]|nr:hypothetical protein KSS87_003530 [Heliosperma pusillum]